MSWTHGSFLPFSPSFAALSFCWSLVLWSRSTLQLHCLWALLGRANGSAEIFMWTYQLDAGQQETGRPAGPTAVRLFLAVLQCHTPMGELVVPLDNQRAGWRSVSVSIKLKVQNKTLFIVLFIHMYQIHKSTNIFSSSDFGSQMNIKWTNDIHTLPSHHYNFKSPFSLSYATSNSMGRVFQFLTWQKHSFCET